METTTAMTVMTNTLNCILMCDVDGNSDDDYDEGHAAEDDNFTTFNADVAHEYNEEDNDERDDNNQYNDDYGDDKDVVMRCSKVVVAKRKNL